MEEEQKKDEIDPSNGAIETLDADGSNRRPRLITFLIALHFLWLAAASALIVAMTILPPEFPALETAMKILGYAYLIVTSVMIPGILLGKQWARILGLIFGGLMLLLSAVEILIFQLVHFTTTAYGILMLWALLCKESRHYFSQPPAQTQKGKLVGKILIVFSCALFLFAELITHPYNFFDCRKSYYLCAFQPSMGPKSLRDLTLLASDLPSICCANRDRSRNEEGDIAHLPVLEHGTRHLKRWGISCHSLYL